MRKPRESKYQKMIGKKINEIFTDVQMKLESENYEITGYDNPTKVSASGRVYRTYKVQLEKSVWISTQTFNKYVKRGFFSKNVHKKIDNARIFERFNESINNEFEPLIEVVKPVEVKEEPTKFELVVSEFQKDRNTFSDLRKSDDLDAFMGCETEEEVKETYKRLAKIYHPDCGGLQIQFETLKDRYEFALRRVRRYAEVVGEIKEMEDLRTTYSLKDLKSAYRKLSMKHHPDHGGDVEQFKLVKTIYDVRKRAIEENVEVFGYDDPNFAFLVDLNEELIKSMERIQY